MTKKFQHPGTFFIFRRVGVRALVPKSTHLKALPPVQSSHGETFFTPSIYLGLYSRYTEYCCILCYGTVSSCLRATISGPQISQRLRADLGLCQGRFHFSEYSEFIEIPGENRIDLGSRLVSFRSGQPTTRFQKECGTRFVSSKCPRSVSFFVFFTKNEIKRGVGCFVHNPCFCPVYVFLPAQVLSA